MLIMPRLLQINITANLGSTGRIAEAIGASAIVNGWESYIAYGRWSKPSKSTLIKIGGRWDKYFHFAEQRIRDNEGLCSRFATRQLVRRIDEIKPDVVQLHNIHDHYLNYCVLFEYLNKTDIKVVWTFHDCWAFTGHCFHFVTAGCEKWKTGCYNCPMKNVLPKTLQDSSKKNYELKRQLFSGCENLTIVPCSDWMAEFVRHSFLKDKEITVIKNGVDLSVFKPLPLATNGKIRILGVSNVWNKDKGLFDFYRLRGMLDPGRYEIVLVGLGASQVKALPAGIIGVERTQSLEELVSLYSSASVLVNPTYADTFPTVNLEAMACGTPVITYRTGGSPEAVTFETGWIVERGDVEGIASIVKDLASRPESEIEAQRIACRTRAVQKFDKDKCFEKYVELYEEIIQR